MFRVFVGLVLLTCSSAAQGYYPRPDAPLPDETAGLDKIAQALVSTFDHLDILAIGDTHQRRFDSELRIAVVRQREFARKVRFIVVEFANTADQPILDRYINGENVPLTELQRVWRNTCCPDTWDSPVYAEFLAAVRDVNKSLPANLRLRVLAGDPPAGTPATERDRSAVSVLNEHVLGKGAKALVIYGGGHLIYPVGEITKAVQAVHPGRIFVVEVRGGQEPEFQRFDRALKSSQRPVLVPLSRPPFDAFSADFLGRGNKKLVDGVWVDVPPTPGPPLGAIADAFVYIGSGPDADTFVRPVQK
jgi:hypothetical protein